MSEETSQPEKNADQPADQPTEQRRRASSRSLLWSEWIAGSVIRLCGYSAIIFVFGIFFFVFREAAPLVFRSGEDWYRWTAVESGQLTVRLDFAHERGNVDLFLYDAERQLLDASQSETSGEEVEAEVAPGQSYFIQLVGVDGASQPDFDLVIDGPGGAGEHPEFLDHGGDFASAFDLGTGDQTWQERELSGPLDLGVFFTSKYWRPVSEPPVYGVLALIAGTASVTVLAMVLAVPFGLGAAVFVSEFCEGKTRETLKIVIELLAAIPSVVWGFIAMVVVSPLIVDLTGAPIGLCVLNGGVILALMSVPIIVSVGEDALKAVPDSFREAAMALGASRWQIVYRVLFPAAKNGLLAAVLLGVGRAIGETMAVLMATGHAVRIPTSPLHPVQTLTATIAAELGEAPKGSDHYRILFLIGVLLFVITFVVNLTADLVVKGIRGKKE